MTRLKLQLKDVAEIACRYGQNFFSLWWTTRIGMESRVFINGSERHLYTYEVALRYIALFAGMSRCAQLFFHVREFISKYRKFFSYSVTAARGQLIHFDCVCRCRPSPAAATAPGSRLTQRAVVMRESGITRPDSLIFKAQSMLSTDSCKFTSLANYVHLKRSPHRPKTDAESLCVSHE